MKDLDLHLTLPSGPMTLRFGPGHDELAQEMAQLWAHMAGSEPGAVRVISAPDHPDPTARGMMIPPGPGAAYTLSGYITREVLRGLVGKRLLLHAGVIEHPQLGVVLLVGPSGAGKSRATTVLGREGRYLTDELAIIDPSRFTVQAYPKPVSRVQENGRKRDLTLSSQGLEPALVAGAPDHVVLLNRVDARDDGPSTSASLRRVPLAEALVAIVGQSSSMWQIPEALVMLARLLDRAGGALEVTYVDAEQIAPLLSDPPTPVAEY